MVAVSIEMPLGTSDAEVRKCATHSSHREGVLDWRLKMEKQSAGALSPTISVFGGSRAAEASDEYRLAQELGAAMAQAGFAVATGGYSGTMEAVSRGAREAGGRVIGVVASDLSTKANQWVEETRVVPQWGDRLMKLILLGDGYVALPGGTGTLVELAVAWEMIHKGLLPPKPLVALGEFWRPVITQIESADANSRGLVRIASSVAAAVDALRRSL